MKKQLLSFIALAFLASSCSQKTIQSEFYVMQGRSRPWIDFFGDRIPSNPKASEIKDLVAACLKYNQNTISTEELQAFQAKGGRVAYRGERFEKTMRVWEGKPAFVNCIYAPYGLEGKESDIKMLAN